MHTALVLSQPEQYLETLTEVSNSNHTLIILKGLTVDQAFSKSSETSIVRINQRSKKMSSDSPAVFGNIAKMLTNNKTIAFMDTKYLASATLAIVCILSHSQPKANLQVSSAFGSTSPSSVVSKGADIQVKKRFRTTMLRLAQSGHFGSTEEEKHSLFRMFGNRVVSCLQFMEEKEAEDAEEPIITFDVFRMIFRLPATTFAIAICVLMMERYWTRRRVQVKRQVKQTLTSMITSFLKSQNVTDITNTA